MKRTVDLDKNIKAKTIEKAAEKFAKYLTEKGLDYIADEITESVENGYYCCSNAEMHNLKQNEVTHPETNDWTYYWAIETDDGHEFYAWYIERA